ncbi:MAG: NTP transferase domain-containing protein [Acidobacteria bacterium]|nr:NTP transferase domain-containing protein [Acidobacteriota bacterium]
MKGVVLAGGLGSRLYPLTKITNKHLLPVYSEPMVYFPIRTLVEAGIRDILLVTGGQNAGDFLRLLGNGEAFGLRQLNYAYQVGEGGIAEALRLAEPFADGEAICVILGDNIIEKGITHMVEKFRACPEGAHIVLKEVPDPNRFGVPVLDDGRVLRIEEKPARPASQYAVVGIYFFDPTVFRRIANLVPSARGELEITDLNNSYLAEGKLSYSILDGWWTDAGTFESLRLATNLVAETLQKKEAEPARKGQPAVEAVPTNS